MIMRTILSLLAALVAVTSFAQSRITHDIQLFPKSTPPALGRDIWFAIPQNYFPGARNGKYFMMYIASTKKTTAHIVEAGKPEVKVEISADTTVNYSLSFFTE